jgi:electron transport complex protein RnfC
MIIAQIKDRDTLFSQLELLNTDVGGGGGNPAEASDIQSDGQLIAIVCEGCKEVYFPEREVVEMASQLKAATITTEYICNSEHMSVQFHDYRTELEAASIILVFSCGIGVQAVADAFPDKTICPACDTLPLPGGQGVTPNKHDCAECGECFLNETAGLCPITSCSKGLLNGQCGGAKNGMCEVDKDMECGWEIIYRRLAERGVSELVLSKASIRDYQIETSTKG